MGAIELVLQCVKGQAFWAGLQAQHQALLR